MIIVTLAAIYVFMWVAITASASGDPLSPRR